MASSTIYILIIKSYLAEWDVLLQAKTILKEKVRIENFHATFEELMFHQSMHNLIFHILKFVERLLQRHHSKNEIYKLIIITDRSRCWKVFVMIYEICLIGSTSKSVWRVNWVRSSSKVQFPLRFFLNYLV